MNTCEVILYVHDQQRAADFYAAVLQTPPVLNVPGMSEFDLGGVTLGLMPGRNMMHLLDGIQLGQGQRCELYLRRHDAAATLSRISAAGGTTLSVLQPRNWGESVGYSLDPDGHVLAIAQLEVTGPMNDRPLPHHPSAATEPTES